MIENMSVFVRRFFVEFDRCEALLRLSLAESAVRRSFVPSVVARWTNMSIRTCLIIFFLELSRALVTLSP